MGFVYYRGLSRIDNKTPIVCVITNRTRNRKTGDMLQSWIFREDMNPIEANRQGLDVGFCGLCKHRGIANPDKTEGTADQRSCYVLLMGVSQVWSALKRGNYEDYKPELHDEILKSNPLRMGSFGEFAAIPHRLIHNMSKLVPMWSGYTHLWRRFSLQNYMMASVDSVEEKIEANALGYRTFRVKTEEESRLPDESMCPASAEYFAFSGKKMQCEACQLCNGLQRRARNIVIDAHSKNGAYIQSANNTTIAA